MSVVIMSESVEGCSLEHNQKCDHKRAVAMWSSEYRVKYREALELNTKARDDNCNRVDRYWQQFKTLDLLNCGHLYY